MELNVNNNEVIIVSSSIHETSVERGLSAKFSKNNIFVG